jgi:putative tricarboxylic transport membrane protein
MSLCGVYVSSGNFFDLWLAFGLGVATFLLRGLGYPIANFILALILAPIIEESFRRALTISEGSYEIFIGTPTALVLSLAAAGLIVGLTFKFIQKTAAQTRA